MNFYGSIVLQAPQIVQMYIELDLALFGGRRDYIWSQFKEFTAVAMKEADFGNVSNMSVMTDNAENYGYNTSYYTQLYQQVQGNERIIWQKWLQKTQALFLVSFSPLKLAEKDTWDYILKRYLTIFFR
jgi:hypothetical protein